MRYSLLLGAESARKAWNFMQKALDGDFANRQQCSGTRKIVKNCKRRASSAFAAHQRGKDCGSSPSRKTGEQQWGCRRQSQPVLIISIKSGSRVFHADQAWALLLARPIRKALDGEIGFLSDRTGFMGRWFKPPRRVIAFFKNGLHSSGRTKRHISIRHWGCVSIM